MYGQDAGHELGRFVDQHKAPFDTRIVLARRCRRQDVALRIGDNQTGIPGHACVEQRCVGEVPFALHALSVSIEFEQALVACAIILQSAKRALCPTDA